MITMEDIEQEIKNLFMKEELRENKMKNEIKQTGFDMACNTFLKH